MLIEKIVETAMAEFNKTFRSFCANPALDRLTSESAQTVAEALSASLLTAGAAAYRAYLLEFEERSECLAVNGEPFRFNAVREKTFLTPFGEMTLPRRCYQNKSDTQSHVPLDAAWGMERQYMTPQVREAVLFACAHVTPEETASMLKKCAPFTPHATAIKHVLKNTGALIELHRERLDEAVRAEESAPGDTVALVASMDGATVLLNEKGLRFGRPAERPRGEEPAERTTAYRVAMVGSVSHYGAPEAESGPKLLQSRYTAHMP